MTQLAFDFTDRPARKPMGFPVIVARQAYAAVEPPPSRFTPDGAHTAWAERADEWARRNGFLRSD